ncbi:hypothetical protein cypCar_00025739, partial [Cyprinus carpio]
AVLQNLLMCMLCFYSLYYIVVSLCIGILRVEEVDSLLAPFDYTTQPSWQSPKYLVSVISTEVTYVLGGLIFVWIVEECVWDYAITVTLLHVALTVAVMADFPSTEHWWIALGESRAVVRPKLRRNFPDNAALKMSRQQDEQGVVLTAYTSNSEALSAISCKEQTEFPGASRRTGQYNVQRGKAAGAALGSSSGKAPYQRCSSQDSLDEQAMVDYFKE